jgi:hypothetical protein
MRAFKLLFTRKRLKRYDGAEGTFAMLQKAIDADNAYIAQKKLLEQEASSLEKRMDQIDPERVTRYTELTSEQSEDVTIDHLERQASTKMISEMNSKITLRDEEINNLQTVIYRLETHIKSKNDRHDMEIKEKDQMISELQKKIDSLEKIAESGGLNSVRQELHKKDTEIANFRRQTEDKVDYIENIEREVVMLRAKVDSFEKPDATHQELHEKDRRIADLLQEVEYHQTLIETIKRENAELMEKVNSFEKPKHYVQLPYMPTTDFVLTDDDVDRDYHELFNGLMDNL